MGFKMKKAITLEVKKQQQKITGICPDPACMLPVPEEVSEPGR